jgi:hypothetical protein
MFVRVQILTAVDGHQLGLRADTYRLYPANGQFPKVFAAFGAEQAWMQASGVRPDDDKCDGVLGRGEPACAVRGGVGKGQEPVSGAVELGAGLGWGGQDANAGSVAAQDEEWYIGI